MGKRQTETGDITFAGGLNTQTPGFATMPCACDDRTFCGDIDIRIKTDGTWLYNATPINRPEMVQLFASMLKLDEEGRHWLVTPTEIGRIQVDDAPFVIVDFHVSGEGEAQVISCITNVDDVVCIDVETPMVLSESPVTGEQTPYVTIAEGLKAQVSRAVYYELMELGKPHEQEGQPAFGLWSSGTFFPLGPIDLQTHDQQRFDSKLFGNVKPC